MGAGRLTTQLAVLLNQFRRKNNAAAFEIADALEVHINHVYRWLAIAECAEEKEAASRSVQPQIDFDFEPEQNVHDDNAQNRSAQLDFDFDDEPLDDILIKNASDMTNAEKSFLADMLIRWCHENNMTYTKVAVRYLQTRPTNISAWENCKALPSEIMCERIQKFLRGEHAHKA